MSFPCLTTIGVLILAFSLSSTVVVVILESPYTCELKIVTGLPWESFQFLIFCVVVSRSSLPSARYLIMHSWFSSVQFSSFSFDNSCLLASFPGRSHRQYFIASTLPPPYFILEAMKYWRWERPGNEATCLQCRMFTCTCRSWAPLTGDGDDIITDLLSVIGV